MDFEEDGAIAMRESFMVKMNMPDFYLDNIDPVLAAFLGSIFSGIFLLNKLGFFRIWKKITLRDEKGVLIPSALFLLSPFLSPIFLNFLSGFNKESSLGLTIFASAFAIFVANILVENFKKNQIKKKTAKILLNTIDEHQIILSAIKAKLDSIKERELDQFVIEQIKSSEIEINILNTDNLFKEALREIVLFETDIIDTITEYSRELSRLLNSKNNFLEPRIETIDNLEIQTRRCKINATLCLVILTKKIIYIQEDFDSFKNLLKGEYEELRRISDLKKFKLEKKIIQIERLFKEFGISNQLEPFILGYSEASYKMNKRYIAYY
jgi:hypothetical protein